MGGGTKMISGIGGSSPEVQGALFAPAQLKMEHAARSSDTRRPDDSPESRAFGVSGVNGPGPWLAPVGIAAAAR